ncbi:MAG: hypothetical protein E5299_02491 [Burkholderia gladioli]|nr:MAG: hypothetical protein E5299_02491 [Burkholderia gladioli]
MHVDPAGGGKNGDETGYAVVGFLNGNIWVLDVGGVPGGYSVEGFKKLAGIARDWKVNRIIVEKNFGFGAYLNTWLPILRGEYVAVNNGDGPNGCAIEEVYETGQKELRIIDTLEPVIARGALIFNDEHGERTHPSLAIRWRSATRTPCSIRSHSSPAISSRCSTTTGWTRWLVLSAIGSTCSASTKRRPSKRSAQPSSKRGARTRSDGRCCINRV